jgi:hypothetical protein
MSKNEEQQIGTIKNKVLFACRYCKIGKVKDYGTIIFCDNCGKVPLKISK